MSKQDDADAAFYDNPENLRTHGPVHRRAGHPRLSSHTPVRFDPDTIATIRQFSDDDGVTVSAWVRRAVDREIKRCTSLRARTTSSRSGAVSFDQSSAPVTTTSAAASVKVLSLRQAS
jgi:hypothetical protein